MTESEPTAQPRPIGTKGHRGLRFALVFVPGAKLGVLAQGDGPALASGASAKTVQAGVAGAPAGAADMQGATRPDVRALLEALGSRQALAERQ